MAALKFLVIHCLATAAGKEITSTQVRKWHTAPVSQGGRGWKQVGYTDILHLNGGIENLVTNDWDDDVELWEITNGVAGMNSKCIHIAYVGGLDITTKKPMDTRTPEQCKALEAYVKRAIKLHPGIQVAGHYQFDSGKACPSFNVPAWLTKIGVKSDNIYNP